jgi:HEPN domain-containing protein
MIYELFSLRKRKAENSGLLDVYQYDDIPKRLRVQIQQILLDAIGPQFEIGPYSMGDPAHNPELWKLIHKTLCRELGVHELAPGSLHIEQVMNFIGSAEIEGFLDAVELCCRIIDRIIRDYPDYRWKEFGIKQGPDDTIVEVNYRFRESGLGYSYEDGQFLRVDSEYVHEEIVKPALRLLSGNGFSGPQAEFLEAHKAYRSGAYSQAIVEAGKSLESTLKAVCDNKGWSYDKGARASDLLKRVRTEGLWPEYLDPSFDQLLATLSSALPKVRNEQGAHGQGSQIRPVPEHIAAYALHLAAAKIRLICEAAQ